MQHLNFAQQHMQWGDSALTAPVTPDKRMPVIDKSKIDPETLKAAQGMEAMFLDYMYKVMRETVPKNDMDMESPATEIYRSMQDSENAQKAAQVGGIGLADQIIAYMESQRYTLPSKTEHGNVSSNDPAGLSNQARPTGGTHEGR
jgi:Rod binding domain-containing protein